MRLRNVKNAKEIIDSNELVITENIFKDDKPLHIEIGCGKGNFIIGKARQNLLGWISFDTNKLLLPSA